MSKTFRSYLPEQDLLLPASLREWLPDDHLAYFVSDVVDQLDLSVIERVYEEEERGQPPSWQARFWADLVSRGKAATYRYFFTRVPPVPDGVFREQKVHPLGAFHQSEIVYVFGTLDTRNWMWTDTDRKLSGVMMAYRTNFAKTGDPNGANLPNWTPSDPENDVVMGFGDSAGMRPGPSKAALAFWDSFYSKGSPAD